MPPQPPRKIRRFAPELNAVKNYFPQMARVVNQTAERLGLPDRVQDLPQLYELLWRMQELFGLVQDSVAEQAAGHIIQDEGVPLIQRPRLNFVGAGVTASDNSVTETSEVSIPGGGAGAFPPLDLATSYVFDDFAGGTDAIAADGTTFDFSKIGSQGQIGWLYDRQAAVSPHADTKAFAANGSFTESPGVYLIQSAQAEDRIFLATPGGAVSGLADCFSAHLAFEMRWVFWHANRGAFGAKFRLGFIEATTGNVGVNVADPPAGGYIEFEEDADTNYQLVWDDGTTHNETDSGVAPHGFNDRMDLVKITHAREDDELMFSINNGTPIAIAFYDGTGGWPFIGPYAEAALAAGGTPSAGLFLDFYDCLITALTRI